MVDKKTIAESKAQKKTPGGVERYLVDMKELPTTKAGEKKVVSGVKKQVEKSPKTPVEKPESKKTPKVVGGQRSKSVDKEQAKPRSDLKGEDMEKDEKAYTTKDVILGIINVITIILLVILLIGLPEKAEKLKMLRNEDAKNDSSVTYEFPDIEVSKSRSEELGGLFVDDMGIVEFVRMVEEIKAEEGSVKKIYFTSQKVVADRTGSYGIPVIIQMRGSWEQIGLDMAKIQKLPYLFRAVNIDVERSDEDSSQIKLDYGGFLYVADEMGQD